MISFPTSFYPTKVVAAEVKNNAFTDFCIYNNLVKDTLIGLTFTNVDEDFMRNMDAYVCQSNFGSELIYLPDLSSDAFLFDRLNYEQIPYTYALLDYSSYKKSEEDEHGVYTIEMKIKFFGDY